MGGSTIICFSLLPPATPHLFLDYKTQTNCYTRWYRKQCILSCIRTNTIGLGKNKSFMKSLQAAARGKWISFKSDEIHFSRHSKSLVSFTHIKKSFPSPNWFPKDFARNTKINPFHIAFILVKASLKYEARFWKYFDFKQWWIVSPISFNHTPATPVMLKMSNIFLFFASTLLTLTSAATDSENCPNSLIKGWCHPPTHPLTHPLTHSPTQPLIHPTHPFTYQMASSMRRPPQLPPGLLPCGGFAKSRLGMEEHLDAFTAPRRRPPL